MSKMETKDKLKYLIVNSDRVKTDDGKSFAEGTFDKKENEEISEAEIVAYLKLRGFVPVEKIERWFDSMMKFYRWNVEIKYVGGGWVAKN